MSYSELTRGELVAAYDVTCHAPQSGFGTGRVTSVTEVVLMRRGAFVIDVGGRQILADAGSALVLGPGEEFHVAHPGPDGDAYTLLRGDDALVEELLGCVRGAAVAFGAQQQLAVRRVTKALRASALDRLEADEIALSLLATVGEMLRRSRRLESTSLSSRRSARVDRARAILAAAPTLPWRLDAIAREVACSPFHLARDFRAVTGETMTAYLLRLRLGFAIDRLADGEANLAALALDAGFAHHSHFTSRFHRAFGLTPSQAFTMKSRHRADDLRELLAS